MPPMKYTQTAIKAMTPKTPPGPRPCWVGSAAPPHADDERTSKKKAHSSGSVPTNEIEADALTANGSFSQRKEMIVDFLRWPSLSLSFPLPLSLSLSLSLSSSSSSSSSSLEGLVDFRSSSDSLRTSNALELDDPHGEPLVYSRTSLRPRKISSDDSWLHTFQLLLHLIQISSS
jgi:hypothetical protein